MHKTVQRLIGELIISCQAYEDTPLYGPENMKIMAQSVLLGGAKAIRSCWPQDIKAIRELGDFPIIGINKKMIKGQVSKDGIIITPTLEDASEVIEAGCDVLALDCTIRECRGKADLLSLLKSIKDKYPNIPIMADCCTFEEGVFAAESGYVDIVSTTLSGMYTNLDKPDVELIRRLKAAINIPINAEGHIWDLKDLNDVLEAKPDMVTIGTAITRPHLITERFINFNNKFNKVK
ncbi:MAG: putative N-acetylmannosamine-6-phosphate 2-epimerase [Erysipelotrichaceae bacterium]